MQNKILVLGATKYQLPTIQRAISLGYHVVTTDNVPQNPGHALAHESYNIDTTDVNRIISIAKKTEINGVISPCTDVAVVSAAAVAQTLGLPGPPINAAKILTSKLEFRNFLLNNFFPSPFFRPIFSYNYLFNFKDYNEKFIIKPNRSSGSKGVFIITNNLEFNDFIHETLNFSLDKTAILEKFFSGSQHTCEGVLYNGRIQAAMLTDRLTAPPPYVATWGHIVPSTLTTSDKHNLITFLELIFSLLDVKNGPFDCDFVKEKDGTLYLLELSPRLGGNSLSDLFYNSLEGDLVEYAVKFACGEKNELKIKLAPKPTALILLGVLNTGRATWNLQEEKALQEESWVLNLSINIAPGSWVEPFINGRKCIGEFLIREETLDKLDLKIKELQTRLNLKAI
jgi:biotin carboxylase